jgi:hypothetical protein
MLAEGAMKENPFTGNLFLFLNKRGTTIKALYWDANGFCLWMKRLEEDRFRWPAGNEFRAWLDQRSGDVPPESLIGKAISYTLGQWEKLVRYTNYGFVPIDNPARTRCGPS